MGELAVVVLIKSGEGGRGIRDLTGGDFAIVIGVQGSDEGREGRTFGSLGAGRALPATLAVWSVIRLEILLSEADSGDDAQEADGEDYYAGQFHHFDC